MDDQPDRLWGATMTIACHFYVQGNKRVVATISDGGFFGEVALVTHAPRAADVVAASPKVKLLSLGRDAFERLMGEKIKLRRTRCSNTMQCCM